MFNVTVKGNVRCNGLLPSGAGGMVKRSIQSSAMPPNRGHTHNSISDTKLKFSDRLKAYLSTDGLRSDATTELDDPYTFSDGEVVKPSKFLTNHTTIRKTAELRAKVDKVNKDTIRNKVNKVNNITNHVDNHNSVVKSENNSVGSGKTMSRLQAQIARNKVTVKHNRNSPDLKLEKNYFDKSTKHSIIGLVNNVNISNTRSPASRRLPTGKPIPAHLRARRISKNTTQESSLQRIPSTITISNNSLNHNNHNNHVKTSNNCKVGTSSTGSSGIKALSSKLLINSLKPTITSPNSTVTRWHAPQPYGPLAGSRTSISNAGNSRLLGNTSDSDEEDGLGIYQRHWFNKELEILSAEESSRETRLEITRRELKRQLLQMKKSKIGSYRTTPLTPTKTTLSSPASIRSYIAAVAQSLALERRQRRRKRSPTKSPNGLMAARHCETEGCTRAALPCTKHCVMHIMHNQDQVLFDHCTAKFADNTQCSVPVFDITHELPLCIEHARKRDNYNRMCLETKPKKPRRKIKPSAMIRPQKRNKKRKRSTTPKSSEIPHTQTTPTANNNVNESTELNVCETSSAYESSEEIALGALSESEFVTINGEDHIGDQDVVEQVLAMQDEVGGDLELVVEQTLVTQASRLLEETDFTNVLNQIPADEFNDLFAVDRNGEYEPSREETEELERALEAVDEDVKSLEKLSATQGLLDSLLDEHTLVESLVQIPDVFHNGYEVIDSPSSHQSSPRQLQAFHHQVIHGVDGMLPVQPQAHTPS